MKTLSFVKKILIPSFLLAAFQFFGFAESFRTGKLSLIVLRQEVDFEEQRLLGTNEALAIQLPEEKTFIEGIEIKMDIPEAIAYWQDCVACSIYNKISPAPSEQQIDYSGTRQFVSTLPGRLSWVLQIPLKKENSLKQNMYTTLMDSIVDFNDGIIFLRLQPVMKGVPEEAMESKIKLTVKPILSDKGEFKLSLSAAGNKKLESTTIYVDDKVVPLSKAGTAFLDKGVHNLSVVSTAYRNEVRTLMIDRAKTTELLIELKSIEPSIILTAPEGTVTYIDDKPFTIFGKEAFIEEGEHKIRFTVGDYEIVRTINVIKGKTYKVNCSVDLQIQEE